MEDSDNTDISRASNTQIVQGLIDANAIRKLVDAHGNTLLLVNEDVCTLLKHL
jgi:hypothetical protein